jgi:hypothetical protein
MEPEEIEAALRELERARDQQRQDFDKLKREFELLNGKLRFPGTDFLIRLEYQAVYEGTILAAASTLTTAPIFDTLPSAQHALYHVSAYAPTSSVPILVTDGSLIVNPSDPVTVAILRQLRTGPTRIECRVAVYNFTGGEQTIAVKVWKRLGMK